MNAPTTLLCREVENFDDTCRGAKASDDGSSDAVDASNVSKADGDFMMLQL